MAVCRLTAADLGPRTLRAITAIVMQIAVQQTVSAAVARKTGPATDDGPFNPCTFVLDNFPHSPNVSGSNYKNDPSSADWFDGGHNVRD